MENTAAVTLRSQRTRALLMLVLATFYWGLSFPVIKALALIHRRLLPEAGTNFWAVYTIAPRFLLASIVLVIWAKLRGERPFEFTRGELKQGVIIGLFAAVGMLFQNDGLQFTNASTSAFLTQFYAILIPVYLALRVRHDPGPVVWLCCLLVLVGVAILGNFNPIEQLRRGGGLTLGRGEWETLLSSLFFMGQILWLEKKEFADNRPAKLSLVMFATEGVVFWALAFAVAPASRALLLPWADGAWLGLTALLTAFCTVGSFLLMNRWQPKITATEAGLIYCIEPIFGSIMACFLPAIFSAWARIEYPNETATWTLLVGGGLITVANVLLQLKPPAEAAR
jgi:drug/metabolite transporter (DMT)-like permease